MVTCVVQQSSLLPMSDINYPRKLFRAATYDSLMPVSTCRKRLLSEQNDCHNIPMKFSNDDIHINKKTKLGKYIYTMNEL
jgi:hypothetical protein